MHVYRYIFSFTLKLITTLLQKLAIFHVWNVKQKMMEWSKTHFTVVMMNMWLQISKLK